MIKIITLVLFVSIYSFGYSTQDIIKNYKKGNYKSVCTQSSNHIYKIKDEEILSLIADACLRVDSINPLGDVVKKLLSTSKYRENASYFATILLQKKLIYQFMNDGIDLSDLRLPRTSYVLSIVFENIAKKNYKIIDKTSKKIEIDLGVKKYIIWLSKNKPPKVFIDEYKNDKLFKRHWYL